VALGDAVSSYALKIADQLRRGGCRVIHCGGGSAKRQFKVADREQVRFVAVIGEDEMHAASLRLKDMQSGEQVDVSVQTAIAQCRSMMPS